GAARASSSSETDADIARESCWRLPSVPTGMGGCRMLCAVGDLVEDVVVWLSEPPRGATDTPVRVFHRRGGSAANVAAFAAGIDGSSARFTGRGGAAAAGDRLVNGLVAAGVDARVQRVGRTGTIVVLVAPVGERTMLTDRGASTALTAVP